MSSEEFRISAVHLRNYRQYYGDQVAEFSKRDEGFSIFLGENGEGKSNLLNAINWCLFRTEPHKRKNKNLPIINTKYLEELKENEPAEMQVIVELEKGNEKYRISRIMKGTKHKLEKETIQGKEFYIISQHTSDPVPVGFEIFDNQVSTSFQKSVGGGTYEEQTQIHDFTTLVNQIIPKELSSFFILDGEFLEKLFENFEQVEEGITQISQLNILNETIEHIQKLIRKTPPGFGQEIDKYSKEIEERENYLQSKDKDGNEQWSDKLLWKENDEDEDEYYHVSGKLLLKDLEKEVKKINKKMVELIHQIHDTNAASSAKLQEEEKRLESTFNSLEKEYDSEFEQYQTDLVTVGPQVFLKEAIQTANNLIEKEIERGTLPNRIKVIFTEDLLTRGTCVCGTDLHGDSNARKSVEEIRDKVTQDSNMDIASEMRYTNRNTLKNYKNTLKKFDDRVGKLTDLKTRMDKTYSSLQGIRIQMKNIGGQDFAKLMSDREWLQNQLNSRERRIGELEADIKKKETDIKELYHKRTNAETRDDRAKKLLHQMNIWEESSEQLENIFNDLKEEIKTRVQNKTTEFFKQIMWKEGYFDQIIIDPDYKLRLLTKAGYDAMEDLSAGERLFLALAFIAAIRDITGYRFPLVIDTPLGKISGTPRRLLANKFPKFLPNSQLTLLATDTEYIAPIPNMDTGEKGESFKEILNKSINTKEFRIKFDIENFSSQIVEYTTPLLQSR